MIGAEDGAVESAEATYGRTASFGQRFLAELLDAVLIAVASFLISRVVKTGVALNAVVWPLMAAYYTLLEGRADGQTIGKRVLRIRVVDDVTDERIGFPRALLRFVVSYVSLIVLLFGYLAMLGDSAGQTWHDKAARSLVIPVDAVDRP